MRGNPASVPVLAIRRLRKAFGARVLIAGLDLDIGAGEYVAVTGESGVGKSTLLNMIAALEPVDAGSIMLDGVEVAALDDDASTALRRTKIGFVFQAFHVLPHLTLAQNVELPLLLNGLDAPARHRAAAAMLASVGLGERLDDFPHVLSGGELQRVAIARALVHRPRLILADEPTGNLDPETAASMLALLRAAIRDANAAAILVTHSPAAAATCDRIVRLDRDGAHRIDVADAIDAR
jgi:putative ABC transport system ATP-binding protein